MTGGPRPSPPLSPDPDDGRLDRRTVLRLGGLAVLGSAAAGLGLSACSSGTMDSTSGTTASAPATTAPPLDAAAWSRFASSLDGKLVRPGDPSYLADLQLYDPRYDSVRPAGIAYCASPSDVQRSVDFARTRPSRVGRPVGRSQLRRVLDHQRTRHRRHDDARGHRRQRIGDGRLGHAAHRHLHRAQRPGRVDRGRVLRHRRDRRADPRWWPGRGRPDARSHLRPADPGAARHGRRLAAHRVARPTTATCSGPARVAGAATSASPPRSPTRPSPSARSRPSSCASRGRRPSQLLPAWLEWAPHAPDELWANCVLLANSDLGPRPAHCPGGRGLRRLQLDLLEPGAATRPLGGRLADQSSRSTPPASPTPCTSRAGAPS